jgi:hypothetical protein
MLQGKIFLHNSQVLLRLGERVLERSTKLHRRHHRFEDRFARYVVLRAEDPVMRTSRAWRIFLLSGNSINFVPGCAVRLYMQQHGIAK